MSYVKCACPRDKAGSIFMPMSNRVILLGVSGGIAAFKAAGYARNLVKCGARVITVMTANAQKFVTPVTFAALTGEKVHTDTFDLSLAHSIPHITIARKADIMLMLPATANIIAKAANGIADDLLSTLYLAFSGPAIFCPAMNPLMYSHAATRDNIKVLEQRGHRIVDADFGDTACGEKGQGRLASWNMVRETVIRTLTSQDLAGFRVLVTAGPTREPVDPVRFMSNRSSGKMGYAIAAEARRRGADVVLVSGPCAIAEPCDMVVKHVVTAEQMATEVEKEAGQADIIIMAAAVADYAPMEVSALKIKKTASELAVKMKRTRDILAWCIDRRRSGQVIAGFCAETGEIEQKAMAKLDKKPVDLLIANDITEPGAGFDGDTNRVLLIDRDHNLEKLPLMSKEEVAVKIMDRIHGFFH